MIEIEINLPRLQSSLDDKDTTVSLSDMTWEDYECLIENNDSSYRISYHKRVITIMSPSRNHERIAQTISILISAYCRKFQLRYFALGSTDIKNPPQSGKQPDASYCFNTEKKIPDLAIEVIYSSGGISDLDKYQSLNVREVWLWQNEQLKIYWLEDSKWNQLDISQNLTRLNFSLLNRYIQQGLSKDHLTIEQEFSQELESL